MKKKIEQILHVEYLSPHAPPDGTTWKYRRCGDCFCTEQKVHTHSMNEEYIKPLVELFKKEKMKTQNC